MSHQVNYFEVASPHPEAARAFYSGLFDWSMPAPETGDYTSINGMAGGLWDTTPMGGQQWAIFYVQVEDVAATVTDAVARGASVALPLVDNGQIQFAHLLDPEGNRFGVWHPLTAP